MNVLRSGAQSSRAARKQVRGVQRGTRSRRRHAWNELVLQTAAARVRQVKKVRSLYESDVMLHKISMQLISA